jgi:alpha-beta hydrolase superfamily lysophospholipase
MYRTLFTIAVTAISRTMVLRDRLLRRMPRNQQHGALPVARYSIRSEKELLDAVFVTPAGGQTRAALLICHGIGEIVDHWIHVQRLLAERGIATLVFDYAGYGKSTGAVDWRQCEEDAVSSFEFLKRLVPGLPVSVLGFSMGSGIAAAVLPRLSLDQLFLCAAFTSFREGACALGIPRKICRLVPPIWDSRPALRRCASPVLIVHCELDRVFPLRMASELASYCKADVELVTIPNMKHNEPFYRPCWSYWKHIASRLPRSEAVLQGNNGDEKDAAFG